MKTIKPIIFIFLFFFCLTTIYSQQLDSSSLKQKVLSQLNISLNDIQKDLFVDKVLPYNKSVSIVIIPKIIDKEIDSFVEYDAYILLVDNYSGKILSRYYKSKAWTSDAIYISSIEIDVANYDLNSNVKAFGIRVNYISSSRPNPYEETELSLFIQHGNNLDCVLKNYIVARFSGERNLNCEGKFETINSTIIIDKKMTNNFYNLIVKSKSVTIENEKVNNNCVEKIIDKKTSFGKLIFNGLEYQ